MSTCPHCGEDCGHEDDESPYYVWWWEPKPWRSDGERRSTFDLTAGAAFIWEADSDEQED
jgi:hypothetical protein